MWCLGNENFVWLPFCFDFEFELACHRFMQILSGCLFVLTLNLSLHVSTVNHNTSDQQRQNTFIAKYQFSVYQGWSIFCSPTSPIFYLCKIQRWFEARCEFLRIFTPVTWLMCVVRKQRSVGFISFLSFQHWFPFSLRPQHIYRLGAQIPFSREESSERLGDESLSCW